MQVGVNSKGVPGGFECMRVNFRLGVLCMPVLKGSQCHQFEVLNNVIKASFHHVNL